jgi:hypothetical protein
VPYSSCDSPGTNFKGRVQGVVSSTGEMNRLFAVISCLGLSCDPRCESRLPIRDASPDYRSEMRVQITDPRCESRLPIRDASPDYRSEMRVQITDPRCTWELFCDPRLSCDPGNLLRYGRVQITWHFSMNVPFPAICDSGLFLGFSRICPDLKGFIDWGR